MSLFGPPNIEKMLAECDMKGLISALGYKKDKNVRLAAAKALAKIDKPAVEPLIAALEHKDVDVRSNAVIALWTIGDPRAVEPLILALKDRELVVRLLATQALGEIGDLRAIQPLIATLKDKEENQFLGESLVKIGKPAVEPLIAALKDNVPYARRIAAGTLGEIGDPRAVEPLVTALKDDNKEVRSSAAEALGKIGDPCAVEPLIAALKDQYSFVRLHAVGALGTIGDPRAVEPLIAALKDDGPYVREKAFEVLGKFSDPRAVKSVIPVLLNKHMERLSETGKGDALSQAGILGLLRQLSTDDLLTFVVDQIDQKMPEALAEKKNLHATGTFGKWFVAVSVCPWLKPEEVKANLGQEYMELLNGLAEPAVNTPEGKHIAHWIYCSNGSQAAIHLTLIPNPKSIYTGTVFLAEDLLTPQERHQFGLAPLAS